MRKLYPSLKNIFFSFCVKSQDKYVTQTITSFASKYRLKQYNLVLLVFAVSAFCSQFALAQVTSVTITTTGSGTWTAPCNVGTVTVECWGGGGGGGNSNGTTTNGGTGGGGGAYAKGTHTLTSGNTYYYNIGTGGVGSPTTSVSAGISSWFNATGVNASPGSNVIGTLGAGGGIGVNNSTATPANAGAAASCFGNVTTTSGSNGVAGSTTGGGAGGAGATPGGGAGGNGSNTANGSNGTSPGGAGGGGNDAAANFGGNGAAGQIVITWTNSLPTITLGTNPTVVKGTTSANLPYTATTNSPNQYSITWSSAAIAAGFVNVTNAVLPASPITLTLPAGAATAIYSGTITVTNTTTGCSSSGTAFTATISYPIVEAFVNQTFCASTYTVPTAYNTVAFSLVEAEVTDFDASQTNATIVLTLPAGFQFNTAVGAVASNAIGSQDITSIGIVSITTTAVTISVTTAATQANIDEINFTGFQIRATANPSSGDLVRTGGTFKSNGSTSIPSSSSSDSFGHLATSGLSVYNSSSVSQYTTSTVTSGCTSTSNPILEFKLNVTGGLCTPNDVITKFVFSTAGSTAPTTDITKAEVYYTDTAQGFSTANFFGSATSPNGTFTITGSQGISLGNGPYYFYLAYTVPATAIAGDVLDATMTSFVYNATTYTNMATPNPAGSRSIITGTCASTPDLAPPTSNTQTITAGSWVIPMDNTNQQTTGGLFNMKAYGLIHSLLQNDIPVKWVIKSGKAKDAADFTANATQVYPTAGTAANYTFVASEFIVDAYYLTNSYYSGGLTATQVMNAYAVTNSVTVVQLNANAVVDVRYTLNHRPKIAVFSNGGNEAIQTAMLTAAGLTSGVNYFVQNAGDFTGLAECYTFCSEAHWDYSSNPDTRPVQRVVDFVTEGGNFLAQCAGIDLYENHQPLGGHFQTTNGVSFSANITNTDYNPDMAYCQYQGVVTHTVGTIAAFWPTTASSSVYKAETFVGVGTATLSSTGTVVASGVHLGNPDSSGYNVFYLGGHGYNNTTLGTQNGIRMYMNATLIPAGRPTAFPISLPANPTICAGQTVSIGPTCASGATYSWGPATALSSTTTCSPIASPTTTTTYSVMGVNGGCIMGPSSITVSVNPTPVMTSTNSATICGNGSVSIPLTSNLTSTYQWIAADNPNTTGESITTQTTSTLNNTIVNTTTSVQTVIYTVTPTSTLGSCAGTPQVVTVTVSPAPIMSSANTATICANSTVNIPLTANIVGSTFTWIAADNVNTTGESLTTQTTATLSNTITNSTISSQNVIYTITPTAGGCLGTAQTATVTVNPTPVMTSTTTATLCSGGTVSIPLTSNIASTYSWIAADNLNTTGESLTTQSTNTLSNSITNSSASSQDVIYTVTPTAGGCSGTGQTVTVTVNPTSSVTSTGTATICTGATVNITLTSNVAGANFTWIATDNTNTTGESLTTQSTATLSNTIINGTTSAQNVIYTVTPFAGGCAGTAKTVTVTVNPTPAMTSANTATICSGGTASIPFTSNVASNYTWIATDNVNTIGESLTTQSTATLSNTITNSSTSVQNVIYTVTPTSTGGSCAGTAQTVTVTVNPTPAITSASTATICSGGTASITLTSNIVSTYTWIAADNVNTTGESLTTQSTATLSNTITNSSTSAQNVIYTVTPTAGGCPGASQTVTITVNPTPAMTSASTATICSGGTVSIPFTSNVASTYTWIATDNVNTTGESLTTQATATLSNTITNSSTSVQNVIYTVTPTSTGGSCAGVAQTITITVNPTPAMTSANTAAICSGNAVSIPFTSNVASTYTWIATDNLNTTGESLTTQATATLSNTITNSSISAQNVIYTVTPTSTTGSCAGAAQTITVTVNPTPVMASASTATICTGNTATINLTSNVAGSTFTWIATDNVNTTGESLTTQATATLSNTITNGTTSAQNVIYTVTPTFGGCTGAGQTVTVTVNPTPAMTSANTATICSGGTASITLTSNVASTYTWIATDNVNTTGESLTTQATATLSNTITNSSTSAQNVIYTVTPTSTGGSCAGTSQTVTITVNPKPAMTSASTATICSGAAVSIPFTSNVASTYTWIATDNVNTTGESLTTQATATLSNTITNNTAVAQNIVYTVTPTSTGGSCTGIAQTITVTVNPAPAMTSASSATICTAATVSIPLTSNVASTYTWIATDNVNTTGESLTTQSTNTLSNTITNGTAVSQNVIYTVTPTSTGGSCVGAAQTVTVEVNPVPTATATPSTQTICSAGATSIALTSNIAGTTYSWTTTQSGVTGASNSSGSNITQTLTATGTSPGTVTYTITPANGCTGSPIVATVTVNPNPVMTSASTATICSGATASINLTSNVASTYTWIATNNANTTGESLTTQSTNTLSNTITNNTITAQSVIYTVTPTSTGGSCVGISQTVTVTVNPTPTATATPSSQTICSTQATSIALTSNIAGTTYSWTVSQSGESGASNNSGSNITQTLTATSTSAGTATYTITPTSTLGSCVGATLVVPITVNPIPTVTATPTSQAFCSGNTTSIALTSSVAGTTYSWTVTQTGVSGAIAAAGSNIAQTISTTGTVTGTAVYTITPTASSCSGTAITATVTVNPIPAMTSAGSATICSNQTVNIPLTSNVASTYTWIATNNPNTTGESITTQTTSTLNNTIISTTGNTETVIYTVTPTSTGGSCAGAAQTVSVTVSPTPIVTVTPTSQAFCSGNATSIALTSNVAGTIFNWTDTQTGVSGASAGSGSSITQTLTTTGVSSGTVTYTITPTIGTCTGTSATATITVNPVPSATATPSSQSICSGNATSIALTSNVGITTYSWTVSQSGVSGATSASGSTIAQTLTTVGTTSGTATYTITPSTASCSGNPIVVTVTVNPVPSATATPATQALCSGSATSIALTSNVTGTTFSWTDTQSAASGASASSGSTITQTLTATGASPGTVTYTITPLAGTCTGSTTVATVTVNPIPVAPTASSNSPVCVTNTISFSVTTVAGATYNWSGPNSYTSNVQNASITNATLTDAGTYSVSVTVNGCTGPNKTLTVVVNPPPPSTVTVNSNSPVCTGQTLSLSTPSVTAASYSWSGPNTFTSSTQNPSISNVTLAANGTYTVSATVPGCGLSGTGTVSVVVNPTPVAPIAGNNGPLCVGATLTLTASNTGTTYSWTGPSTFTSTTQSPSVINITSANAGVYSVTATSLGCTSTTGTTNVVVNPIPATPTVTSNSPLCVGQTLNLSTSAVGGASYSWSGPNSYTSSVQNPSISNVALVNGGTYSLAVTVSGCASATATVDVAVNSTPTTPTASVNNPVCVGDTLFLVANSTGGATYSWTGPNTFTSNIQNPIIAGVTAAANGTYTVIANNGCASAPATVTVAVSPTPAAPVAGSNSPLCVGSTLNLTATNTGATYNWSGPNTYTSSVRNPSITNVTSAEAGVYTVTATSAVGCVSPTATVNIVINSPAIVSAGGSQTVCANNSQVTLSGTSSTGTAQWSSTGTGTFTPNNTTLTSTYTPSAAEITAGTSTLTLASLGNGACAAVTDQIVITITPSPTVSTGGSQTVCANNSQVTLNGTFAVASGISWTSSGSGTFNPDNVTASTTYSPSTADITAGTVTLTIATTGNGNCLAATNTMVVTIKPAPVVNGGADIFVCSNNPNATLSGTSSTGAAQWSTSGTGTFTPNNTTLNATYVSSASDISGGVVTLTLTSNNNVSCLAVADTLTIKYTAPPTVNAGTLTSVCANNSAVALSGTSSTGAGAWTTSGTGTFTPNNTTLNATYHASAADATAGTVTFTLASTNNGGCIPVTSTTTVTITPSPTANAGTNQSVCGNNANVALTGSVTIASGGIWSSTGTGTFSPNNTNMSTTYIPSNADTAAGSVSIILTTSGNANCNATTDTMLVTITNAPHVSAGIDANVCLSSPNHVLNGSSSTGAGIWGTLGSGTFTPNNTTLNATYVPSTADTSAKVVTLIFTSGNNGGCSAVIDTMKIVYTNIPTVNAGGNQTVCGNNANVTLSGSSSTGTGAWASTGTGTFTPNNTTLNGTYIPSNADTTSGNINLTLSSTGGCAIVTQTISVTITDAPGSHAGTDVAVCANNAAVTLNGSVSGATSTGIWSTNGTGTFTPNNSTLNATYTPSSSDTTAGSVIMILTSSGNGTCLAATDTMKITYTHAPHTTVGSDATACANSAVVLSGTVSGGTGNGVWTTTNGSGTFTPNNTTLNASYNTVSADTVPTSITLILTSTNNGGCLASSDSMHVTVNPGPIVNAGTDQTMCANNVSIALSGTVAVATGGQWSSLGSGTFTPNNTTLNANYNPTATEISSGTITLILTSTGNGLCQAVTDTMKVHLTPAPVVNAGADIFICNSSTTTTLSGSVSGGSTTGQWTTLGSGTFTPSNTTLNATYNLSAADTTAGTIKLVLTSTNNLTCNAVTDTVVIKLNSAPNVFAGNDTTLCGNVNTVTLNGSISVGIVGHWTTHGTGTFTPNDSTLNGTYTAGSNDISAGSVVLTLTSNVNGQCPASSDSVKITFSPATIVNAGTNIPVCSGLMTAQLNGIVSGGTTSGIWSTLGSGTFTPNDTTLNAVYNLSAADTTAGSVQLVLTSTHNGGCSVVSSAVTISMSSAPLANAGNDTSVCGNTVAVQLHGSVNGGSGLGIWTSNGTGTFTPDSTTLNANYNPSAADITAGTVTLTLSSIQNGSCPQSADSMKITITPTPTVNAGSNIAICNGAMSTPLNGSITGGSTTGIWTTLGSGTFTPIDTALNATYNLSVADSTAGNVSLVLTSTHNGSCSVVKDTVLITLNSIATVFAGNDTSVCSNSNGVTLHGGITGGSATGLWTSSGSGLFTPNDSTLNATYQPSAADVTAGNVMLTLAATHNCVNNKDSLKLTITPAPVVNAGSNIVICNGTMSTALSGTVTGGTSTGIWNTLGSGTFTPNDSTLNATYNLSLADSTAGNVTLVLSSTHNGSCSSAKDTVLIIFNPITVTSAGRDTTVCSGAASVQLHGAVSGSSATGIWSSLGTGTFTPNNSTLSANYNPSASDITNGNVTLVLTSTNNCVNPSDTMKITFAPTATVNAGTNQIVCSSNIIALSGSVTATSVGHWSTIGTGTFTPNDSTLNATYIPAITDNDTLTFVLAVNQGSSCGTVRDTMVVYRNGQPYAAFTANNACLGQSVSFTDNSTASGGTINNWHWSFGTGDTSSVQNPSYTYTASGSYTVQLSVSSGAGCKDSITKIVNIHLTPTPSFTLSANCMSDSVAFTNSSTISQGNIASWSWSFGDGNSSSIQNPHHLYDSVATYTVGLTAVSDSGCSASITHTVIVHPSPLAGFTTQSNCLKLIVNFKDTSKVILPDSIASYNWSFGDGSTSLVANPAHTYSTSGTYTVLLQVQTNNGCTDTATKVITTGQPVVAQYTPDGGSYNVHQDIDFTNQATGASTYNWNFGDNSTTSTLPNPTHGFNIAGTYTVTLIATNSMGCSDTIRHTFEVNPSGHSIPTGFTPNGDGLNDYFYIMGGPFSQYELRVFNEWGQQIFISNSQSDKWDGTINGTKQPAGTYMYIFNGNVDGKSLKLSGEINLIQ